MKEHCAACGDAREDHPLRACRKPNCPCLKFVLDHGSPLPDTDPSNCWEAMAITGVVELISTHEEGEVCVKTHDGRECMVKVTLRSAIPITCQGGAA